MGIHKSTIDTKPTRPLFEFENEIKAVYGVTSIIESSDSKLRARVNPDTLSRLADKATLIIQKTEKGLQIKIIVEEAPGVEELDISGKILSITRQVETKLAP